MNTPLYLLLTHPAALAAFWWLPGWAARRDAARFNAAPAADDLHSVFHRQRLLERLGLAVALALVSGVPVLLSGTTPYILSTAGLLCAGGGIWSYRFNHLLNTARALPYVGPDYVSPDPRAARFPDRWLWARAMRAYPTFNAFNDAELHQNRVAYAAHELRVLRAVALGTGLTFYAAALVALWALY